MEMKEMQTINLKIERGVKTGKKYCNVTVDEKTAGSNMSRELTRTTDEDGAGVFCGATDSNGRIRFQYGELTEDIPANSIHYDVDNIESITAEITARIRAVRAWVASCDHSEVLTSTIAID
jgi:hypothetical protein